MMRDYEKGNRYDQEGGLSLNGYIPWNVITFHYFSCMYIAYIVI